VDTAILPGGVCDNIVVRHLLVVLYSAEDQSVGIANTGHCITS
jgi:hypothetical protein